MECCKVCNKNEGSPYTFYYGKLSKEFDRFKNVSTRSTTIEHIKNFKIEGSSSEPICGACIHKERTRRLLSAIIWLIIIPAVAVGFGFLVKTLPTEGFIFSVLMIIFFIFLFFGFLFEVNSFIHLIQAIFSKKSVLGEELALGIGQKELQKKSREFWTETEYTKIKIKELNRSL